MPAMNKLAPFLWFNDNAEEAAEFYLSVFPHARKLDELRSKGVGPWPVGKIATITIEPEGQEMVFLNGGPAHQLNPAFSFFVRCDSQEEIDSYWDKLIEGGKPMACGWLTDRFGLCWQIVRGMMQMYAEADSTQKAIVVEEFKTALAAYVTTVFLA